MIKRINDSEVKVLDHLRIFDMFEAVMINNYRPIKASYIVHITEGVFSLLFIILAIYVFGLFDETFFYVYFFIMFLFYIYHYRLRFEYSELAYRLSRSKFENGRFIERHI
ncbi:MAG: hypothetical protein R6U61_02975 [Thermoplasmata archaeon]